MNNFQYILPFFALFSLTAMAPMNLAFALVCIFWLAGRFFRQNTFPDPPEMTAVKRSYYLYAGALILPCLISLALCIVWPISYFQHNVTFNAHSLTKLAHLFFPLIYLSVFSFKTNRTTDQLNLILKVWWITTILLGFLGIFQFFTGIPKADALPVGHHLFHADLLFGHHLTTATVMLFPTFSALSVALGAWARDRKWLPLPWFAFFMGLLALFLSFARAAWLALPFGLVICLVFAFRKNAPSKKNTIIFAGLLALLVSGLYQIPEIRDRVQIHVGIKERINLWKANIDFFEHRPITGIGFLNSQEMSEYYFKEKFPHHENEYQWGHAHSNFFEMLGGTGALGMLGFLAWIFYTLRLAWTTAKEALRANAPYRADLACGLGTALLLMHLNGLTQVNFWEGKSLHQHVWAVGLLLIIRMTLSLPPLIHSAKEEHS